MEAVLLAAGLSSRAGDFKLAWDIGGKSLLARQVELFADICTQLYIVGGHRIEELENLLNGYNSVTLVENRKFASGMFSSVQTGVLSTTDDFFICPSDYPGIAVSTLEYLAGASGDIRIPVFEGRKGHPVFFTQRCRQLILAKDVNSNLREFTIRQGFTPVPVDDPGILYDVDTWEDYLRFLST